MKEETDFWRDLSDRQDKQRSRTTVSRQHCALVKRFLSRICNATFSSDWVNSVVDIAIADTHLWCPAALLMLRLGREKVFLDEVHLKFSFNFGPRSSKTRGRNDCLPRQRAQISERTFAWRERMQCMSSFQVLSKVCTLHLFFMLCLRWLFLVHAVGTSPRRAWWSETVQFLSRSDVSRPDVFRSKNSADCARTTRASRRRWARTDRWPITSARPSLSMTELSRRPFSELWTARRRLFTDTTSVWFS